MGSDGRALFLSANGDITYAGGEAEGEAGCCLWAGIERSIAAGESASGLFFLVPGEGREDGERQAVWSRFTELP